MYILTAAVEEKNDSYDEHDSDEVQGENDVADPVKADEEQDEENEEDLQEDILKVHISCISGGVVIRLLI